MPQPDPKSPDPNSGDLATAARMRTLPLFSLCLSTLNVRQTERDADIQALAEDIAARGLKQNLVVIPAHFMTAEIEGNYGDKFEVIAGGRRYQALRLLAEAGYIEPDHPVPVLVEARDLASETSLSENLHRVAMNPADEFTAFATIVAQATTAGESDPEAYCAKRFGVTRRLVTERLRLAALAPDILEALRKGHIGLDSAKAYAGTEDHELQIKVYLEQAKPGVWKPHDPQTVRSALRGRTLSMGDPLVTYVTLAAYRDAGGRTETEMFMGTDGEERVVNVPLLERLARAKAEGELPAWLKREGWKDAVLASGAGYGAKWPKAPDGFEKAWDYSTTLAELSKAERKRSVAVVAVAGDGDGLRAIGRFKPVEAREQPRGYVPPTEEERLAARREQLIDLWSARLGAGSFDGTPLKGKAFWPQQGYSPMIDEERTYAGDEDEDGTLVKATIAVLIEVPAADIAQARAQAEAKVDELLAKEAAARTAKEAAAAEAGDGDDDVQTENDDEFGED